MGTPTQFANSRANATASLKRAQQCTSRTLQSANNQLQTALMTFIALGQAMSARKYSLSDLEDIHVQLGSAVALTQHAAGRLEV